MSSFQTKTQEACSINHDYIVLLVTCGGSMTEISSSRKSKVIISYCHKKNFIKHYNISIRLDIEKKSS